jgi:hypothetical protein
VPGLTRPRRRAGRGDRGAVTVLVAILLSSGVLLGMTAYAIDIGVLYAYREQALTAANEAAMGAAQTCVRPGTHCGQLDTKYATMNIPGGGVTLRSSTQGETVCGRDLDDGHDGQLDPCLGASGAKGCIGSANPLRTSYTEIHATTTPPSNATVYPANFAGSVVPGWKPYGVQVCSRVTYGAPRGPYVSFGVSLCTFIVLTGGVNQPLSNGFHALRERVTATDELKIMMESQADADAGDTCPDLAYYTAGDSNCHLDTSEGRDEPGTVNNTTSTIALPSGCRNLLDTKERPPRRLDPTPYILMPIYHHIASPNGPAVTLTDLWGIAAFQVTGDHLGDGTTNANQKGTFDWLSRVSESNYCGAGTKPTDRCLRGYFLWVNIVDGTQPSQNWTHTLAIANYKTVG